MKQGILVGVVAAALAAGAGYWVGAGAGSRPHAEQAAGAGPATASTGAATKERKLLFYRNPMGLPDTSDVPKKDPMGMDYIPVYEGEQEEASAAAGQIKISTDKVQKLGVRTEAASLRALDRQVRAAGRVELDERRTYAISPKFEGYVERLYVNATGQPLSKGQPLFEVYSPELVSAQREYAIALQGVEALKGAPGDAQAGMRQLAESSLARLRNWDISDEQVKALSTSGEARRTLTFRSPVAGIVTEKKALQGMRFMPGEVLYQVADLSSVWVMADVFEQDIALLKTGAKARVKIDAYPDKSYTGTIAYVYPTLKSETRTIPVRIEMANPGGLLKPGMFAQMDMAATAKGPVLTVPTSAVIDSGVRQLVLVQVKEGRYEPRDVKLGARSDDRVEVLSGVRDGEQVVVAANFLIDAESNLRAAIGAFGQATQGGSPAPSTAGADKPGAATVGHKAQGKVEEVDRKAGTVTINHAPVQSLKWPAMTMEFKVANDGLLGAMKVGAAVSFEFVERGKGEWVITAVEPAAPKPAAASPHAGH